MNYYLTVFKKYAEFNGRSRRAEYWYFILFHAIIIFVLSIISYVIGDNRYILREIYMLAALFPVLGVTIRRLHDIGRSGWEVLINFVPFIGTLWFIALMTNIGDRGDNKYGPNPKEIATLYN